MTHFRKFAIILTFVCFVLSIHGSLTYRNQVFDSKFKTLLVHPTSQPLNFPLIDLKSGSIDISFDVLSHQSLRLGYKIIHCNADWTKSELFESEFMNGMRENDFPDGLYSESTFVQYIHYRLRLPNENIQLKLSGNYALVVYDKDHPKILISQPVL